jgi:DNA excision repair protein ERCC-2
LLDGVKDGDEELIQQEDFINIVENSLSETLDGGCDIDKFNLKLMTLAESKLQSGTSSAAMDLSRFIGGFMKEHPSMIRVISRKDKSKIFFRLLDPSVVSAEIFNQAHACILMSGTLHPTKMYADILGLTRQDCILGNYKSPFPPENRRIYAGTDVSTLYRERSKEMYMKIARHIKTASDEVSGNVAVFFPSYNIQLEVTQAFEELGSSKELLVEIRRSSKAEKEAMLRRLRKLQRMGGGILLGVMAGSLSEGIDYRDNLLRCVIIVGVPLAPPSLEQTQLERYYDNKLGLGKGKEYGYTSPAMNKVLQAMGRCIRSETDRAVVILLDKRFNYPAYQKLFPKELGISRSQDLIAELRKFYAV